MIAVKLEIEYIPRLETVKVPPCSYGVKIHSRLKKKVFILGIHGVTIYHPVLFEPDL
jgi:hypothetical protein